MRVLIFQTGEPLAIDESGLRVMRAGNLAEFLIKGGHQVTVVSSQFFHQQKSHRPSLTTEYGGVSYHFIPSPGYEANIGVGRFYDHFVLGRNVDEFLRDFEPVYDVAFVGFPPIEAAVSFAGWCLRHDVPYILDVKDLWPQIFVNRSPQILRPFVKMLTAGLKEQSRRVMEHSAALSTISSGFLDLIYREYGIAPRSYDFVSPLTGDYPSGVGDLSMHNPCEEGETLAILFAGTLSKVFDFEPVFKAMSYLNDNAEFNVVLRVAGDGPQLNALKRRFAALKHVEFLGWCNSSELELLYKSSAFSIAPYVESQDFNASVPNKIIESLHYGVPVFYSLSGETDTILSRTGAGVRYKPETLGENLLRCLRDSNVRADMKEQALKLYEQDFKFEAIYGAIEHKMEMVKNAITG